MGVSTTHRINLSMWILIYSFSDTYYVWAACVSIGSMALRCKDVESKMASSILDEKLAESARKYPVLCYKRCADKLKKTLA